MLLADNTGTVEVVLDHADVSFLGTEIQITTVTRRQRDGATSSVTDVRPVVTIPHPASATQATLWTSAPLTPDLIDRLQSLGFRPGWMWWWQHRQTFVEELCVLPEAPLLVLGRVTGEGAYGRLRLGSQVGEQLIVATQNVEQLAASLRAEIRLGAFICAALALFVLVGCVITLLVR
jgi:hypothetical protein